MIIVKIFLEICLLRSGPQDLPASAIFLGVVFVANAFVGLIILSIEAPFQAAVPQFFVSIGLLTAFSWIILTASGKATRLQQTLTALLGADTLISLFALPFLIWISLNQSYGLAYYVLFASMLWSIAVVGHIVRHALSSSYLFGFGLAILYFFTSFQVMAYLFPIVR